MRTFKESANPFANVGFAAGLFNYLPRKLLKTRGKMCRLRDSNPRPTDYKIRAELNAPRGLGRSGRLNSHGTLQKLAKGIQHV